MLPKAVGMDFTEVNFELTEGETRRKDEQTFREIFEFLHHTVNKPVHDESNLRMPSSTNLDNYNKL